MDFFETAATKSVELGSSRLEKRLEQISGVRASENSCQDHFTKNYLRFP